MTQLEALYASYQYQVLTSPRRLRTDEGARQEEIDARVILRQLWAAGFEVMADRLGREEGTAWSL